MKPPVAVPYVTEAEYAQLPETSERMELVDGEIVVPPSPLPLHQSAVAAFLVELRTWARAHPPAWVGLAPCDVRLGRDRVLQPDLFVLAEGLADPQERPITATPALVVEVLSPYGRAYDRLAKRLIYAEAGVREYWLVDPLARTVEVVEGHATVEVVDRSVISRALPDLRLDLAAIWADLGG